MNDFTDDNTRAYIDQLLDDILHKLPTESESAKNTLLQETSRISPASFYAFHQITDSILQNTCAHEAFSTALFVLANLKPLLWSCPLMTFEEELRNTFFRDLYQLEPLLLQYFDPEQISTLNPDAKTYYGYLYTLLCNYSNDTLIIYSQFPFRNPLPVPCGSVPVNPAVFSEENSSPIIPRVYDALSDGLHPWHGLAEIFAQECNSVSTTPEGFGETDCNEWDFFTNTMRFLDACGEEFLSGCLQYLYGTYPCTAPNEPKTVMDFQISMLQPPSDDLTAWLIAQAEFNGTLKAEQGYDSKYILFLHRMIVWYEKSKQTPDQTIIWEHIVAAISKDNCPLDVRIKKLQYIIRQLSTSDFKSILANAYASLGLYLSCDYAHDERNRIDLSLAARAKAIKLFQEQELWDCDNYRNSILSYTILTAESDEGDSTYAVELLLDYIQRQETKENPNLDNIGDAYNRLAYLYAERIGDYQKTFVYYEKYMDAMKQIYGEDSDFIADCIETLADYHEDANDPKGACSLREKALEINIREMGKLYLLPPIFKGIAVSVAKATGAIDPSDKFNRVMSAADSYLAVGDSYYELGMTQKAMDCFRKSAALVEWEFKGKTPVVPMAAAHHRMGNVYYDQGNTQKAEKEYQEAIRICQFLIHLNESRYEIEDCTEILNDIINRTGWE